MPIAHDLQDIIGGVSAAIAAKESWSRTELEKLRRSLVAVKNDAGKVERGGEVARLALEEVCHGIDAGVANLSGLARHARGVAQPAEAR